MKFSEYLEKNNGMKIFTLLTLSLCCLCLWFVFPSSPSVKSEDIIETKVSIDDSFEIKQKLAEFTNSALQKLKSTPHTQTAQEAFQIFHKERSNIFFDKSLFFKKIKLSSEEIKSFESRFLDFHSLKNIQVTRDHLPKDIDERMSLIDFLGAYALKNENSESVKEVTNSFVSIIKHEIPKALEASVKRIVIAEKMDFIRLLTLMDKDLAAETLNTMDEKQKEHLKTNYYMGLKSLGLKDEEYLEMVSRVL